MTARNGGRRSTISRNRSSKSLQSRDALAACDGHCFNNDYAAFAHQGQNEKICYATGSKITGPWTYRGILTGNAKNSYTIHPAIVEFKGQWYFFFHNAALTIGDQRGALGRRAVCVEYLFYNPDGSMKPVTQTTEGVSGSPRTD
jgi:hypothetical protein